MSVEHFFCFIDRAVVDPLLAMRWPDFLRQHPWHRKKLHDLIAFSVEPEPDAVAVADILSRRTLRWTMQHSTPALFLLNEIVDHVPRATRACPEVWAPLDETLILVAAAYDAFLDHRVDARTLQAVFAITGSNGPRDWLDLSASQVRDVKRVVQFGRAETMYPWLSAEIAGDGYSSLRLADTRRFIAFLKRAWEENWPAPRIDNGTLRDLNVPRGTSPRFRDWELTRGLARHARSGTLQKPCMVRYFG